MPPAGEPIFGELLKYHRGPSSVGALVELAKNLVQALLGVWRQRLALLLQLGLMIEQFATFITETQDACPQLIVCGLFPERPAGRILALARSLVCTKTY